MEIINANVLNSNSYDFITIFDNIDVHGKSDNGIKVSYDISKLLSYKTDSQKIEELVRYFIRNHKIVEVADTYDEFIINSSSNIDLRISKNHKLSDKLLQQIYLKYYSDRLDTYSDDVDFYWLTLEGRNDAFYRVTKPKDYSVNLDEFRQNLIDKNCMIINFNISDNNLNYYDNLMLKTILEDVYDIEFDGITLDYFDIYKCTKNGKEICLIIDQDLFDFIFNIESKKNKIDFAKRLQYRMEEFK